MKLYLDSAQVSSWALPPGCAPAIGITTNPSLIHQAGLSVSLPTYEALLQAAADQGFAELMLQLPEADAALALHWQERLRQRAADVGLVLTIKLPCHAAWRGCIAAMRQVAQPVLLTGLSNAAQLLWADAQGAAYVAPYIGRLAADGRDVWPLMEACVRAQREQGPALLGASIKSPDVLARLMACGAAAVTLPPESLAAWSADALTEAAMAQFERDTADSRAAQVGGQAGG
ncbi:MAG: Fructose-6-phosphate aldolase 1 [Pseudomonadota bacterium]